MEVYRYKGEHKVTLGYSILHIVALVKCLDVGFQGFKGRNLKLTQRLLYAIGEVGVVEDDVEAKHLGPQGYGGADTAQTHNAQGVSSYASRTLDMVKVKG